MALGDNRSYVVAILTLDGEIAPLVAAKMGVEFTDLADLSTKPEIRAMAQAAVDKANERLSRPEQVKAWELLPARVDRGVRGAHPDAQAQAAGRERPSTPTWWTASTVTLTLTSTPSTSRPTAAARGCGPRTPSRPSAARSPSASRPSSSTST